MEKLVSPKGQTSFNASSGTAGKLGGSGTSASSPRSRIKSKESA